MEAITAQLSNSMQVIFLLIMIVVVLARLTDGNRDSLFERFALFIMALGAFFQLYKAAHPEPTSLDIIITNCGVAMWVFSQSYDSLYNLLMKWINGKEHDADV